MLDVLILNPFWVTGFIDGECCFHVSVTPLARMKLGYQVQLQFSITQGIRDKALMEQLITFFGCGYVNLDGPNKVQYRIQDQKDLADHLFLFLDQYPLHTQRDWTIRILSEFMAGRNEVSILHQQG
jgi:hypothetical protein